MTAYPTFQLRKIVSHFFLGFSMFLTAFFVSLIILLKTLHFLFSTNARFVLTGFSRYCKF